LDTAAPQQLVYDLLLGNGFFFERNRFKPSFLFVLSQVFTKDVKIIIRLMLELLARILNLFNCLSSLKTPAETHWKIEYSPEVGLTLKL